MVDEIVTTVTVDYSRWFANQPHLIPEVLSSEQQGYFLFGLMALFVIGFGLYFYWTDKQENRE